MRLARYWTAIFASALAAAAQNASPQPSTPLVRVTVNLAQTDVVVTDSASRPVRDLEARDFQLFEDGKPQAITNFSWVDLTPSASAHANVIRGAGDLPPASIPRREDLRRAMVLMVDDAGTNTADLAAILPALRRFVDEQIEPGDLAAVTASRGGMGVYEQLTSDKRQLYAAIDRIGHRPGWRNCDYIPPYVSEKNQEFFHYVPGDFIFSNNACQPADNGYLRWAIEGLSDFPGRKAVVLFSHSFGLSPANAALANRAGVVIYVLDPGGGEPAKVRQPGAGGVQGTAALAAQTGGFRKLSAPGYIGEDLGQVLEDMSGYYLLGYHPPRTDAELQGGAAQHAIEVRVLRPGLTVRARSSIVASSAAAPKAPQTREEFLHQALFSPFRSGGLRLRMEPSYGASDRDAKTKRRAADLRLHLTLEDAVKTDLSALTLDALVVLFRADGTAAATNDKQIQLRGIAPEEAARMSAFGVRMKLDLGAVPPGDYQVRAAVRDPSSGKSGSAYDFLAIPDFNKGALTLATPALGPSTWNEFAPGETVQFSCEIFGSAAAKTQGEIRLYSEDQPLGAPQTLTTRSTGDTRFLTAALPLPSDLKPGDYAIRLVTWDNGGGPSKPTASVWSEFRIRN